jgi:hypothetical protein
LTISLRSVCKEHKIDSRDSILELLDHVLWDNDWFLNYTTVKTGIYLVLQKQKLKWKWCAK